MMQKLLVFIFCLGLFQSYAQESLYMPINVSKAYEKGTRSADGKPGKNYWQNEADYDMKVRLDPTAGKVSGSEKIKYFNHSPDTLKEIVIATYMDVNAKGTPKDFALPQSILTEGVIINRIQVAGEEIASESSRISRSGTNRTIKLENPLLPGSALEMEFDWEYELLKGVAIRTGAYKDGTFFIAYFYPKVAVYDDIDGWDRHDYTLMAEFYSDVNDYEVEVSLPKNYVVWATGELQNPQEVLTEKYVNRLKKAQSSEEVTKIITKEDLQKGGITVDKAVLKWKYKAAGVPDFAFATSEKYLWDGSTIVVDKKTGRKTFVDAAYRVESEDYYKVAALAAETLKNYSFDLPGVPYPYPGMTIFNAEAGMEFPMMCNNVSNKEWTGTVGLAYHEVAHTYFPFLVSTNERKYAWMDEGWASIFPLWHFEKHTPGYKYLESRMGRYYQIAGTEKEVSLMTLTSHLRVRLPYRQSSYNKSFFAYYYLKQMLGDELFKKTFQEYIRRWSYKHPIPYDFFHSFNTVSGKDLNWYWKAWFFEKNHADLAIAGVEKGKVTIKNVGQLPLPVKLEIEYKDGNTLIIEQDLSVWKSGKRELTYRLKKAKKIKRITLGDEHILDVDQRNNVVDF